MSSRRPITKEELSQLEHGSALILETGTPDGSDYLLSRGTLYGSVNNNEAVLFKVNTIVQQGEDMSFTPGEIITVSRLSIYKKL